MQIMHTLQIIAPGDETGTDRARPRISSGGKSSTSSTNHMMQKSQRIVSSTYPDGVCLLERHESNVPRVCRAGRELSMCPGTYSGTYPDGCHGATNATRVCIRGALWSHALQTPERNGSGVMSLRLASANSQGSLCCRPHNSSICPPHGIEDNNRRWGIIFPASPSPAVESKGSISVYMHTWYQLYMYIYYI